MWCVLAANDKLWVADVLCLSSSNEICKRHRLVESGLERFSLANECMLQVSSSVCSVVSV